MIALLTKFKFAAVITAALGILGAGGGAAYVAAAHGALPFAPASLTSLVTSGTPAAHAGKAGGRLTRLVRGTIVVNSDGTYVTRTLDAGTVTALTSTSLSITRADGTTATFAVTSATLFGRARHAVKDPSKAIGRHVVVLSQSGTAVQIGGARALRGAVYADLFVERTGKLIEIQIARGSVQTISASALTVLRADGVTTTGALSANTKWGSARHPLSQSDVHTGTSVTILLVKGQIARVLPAPAASTTGGQA
jgi:hypothetical protein